jgi:hypothetical protein
VPEVAVVLVAVEPVRPLDVGLALEDDDERAEADLGSILWISFGCNFRLKTYLLLCPYRRRLQKFAQSGHPVENSFPTKKFQPTTKVSTCKKVSTFNESFNLHKSFNLQKPRLDARPAVPDVRDVPRRQLGSIL